MYWACATDKPVLNQPASPEPRPELTAGHSRPLVVYCKTGVRGRRAAKLLVEAGFTEVRNLRGGIDRWAREIDPTIPRY